MCSHFFKIQISWFWGAVILFWCCVVKVLDLIPAWLSLLFVQFTQLLTEANHDLLLVMCYGNSVARSSTSLSKQSSKRTLVTVTARSWNQLLLHKNYIFFSKLLLNYNKISKISGCCPKELRRKSSFCSFRRRVSGRGAIGSPQLYNFNIKKDLLLMIGLKNDTRDSFEEVIM